MSDDEKKTVEIAAVPDWAVKLTEKVVGGFVAVNDRLDGLEKTDKTLADQVQDMGVDIRQLRDADRAHEENYRRLSDRTKAPSNADLANEAQLASEITARQELAARVDGLDKKQDLQLTILTRLDSITKNPLVKTIAAMLATAFITWLATKGIRVPQ